MTKLKLVVKKKKTANIVYISVLKINDEHVNHEKIR